VAVAAVAQNDQSIKPSEMPLWIRLGTTVSSKDSPVGSVVEAVALQAHYGLDGRSIPMGSRLTGRVMKAPSKQRSTLRLSFDSVWIDGRELPFKSHVLDVDNAREHVKSDGTIIGRDPVRKRPGIEVFLFAAAFAHPAALAVIEGTKIAAYAVTRAEVRYLAGTDVALAIDEYPAVEPVDRGNNPDLVSPLRLSQLLHDLPNRTETKPPALPSDWINIAFIGSRQSIDQAFQEAGWHTADRSSVRTYVRSAYAFVRHHAYHRAPVSKLLLAHQEPDLVYQKQTNTFAQRHHIRVWSTREMWEGQPIWIAAATHDISIKFSWAAKVFQHRVEADVDLERSKVIGDLRFANRLAALSYVTRPAVPNESRNATGDPLRTDGRLAVVRLVPGRLGLDYVAVAGGQ